MRDEVKEEERPVRWKEKVWAILVSSPCTDLGGRLQVKI